MVNRSITYELKRFIASQFSKPNIRRNSLATCQIIIMTRMCIIFNQITQSWLRYRHSVLTSERLHRHASGSERDNTNSPGASDYTEVIDLNSSPALYGQRSSAVISFHVHINQFPVHRSIDQSIDWQNQFEMRLQNGCRPSLWLTKMMRSLAKRIANKTGISVVSDGTLCQRFHLINAMVVRHEVNRLHNSSPNFTSVSHRLPLHPRRT